MNTSVICAPGRLRRVVASLCLAVPLSVAAGTYDLSVDRVVIDTGEFRKPGIGYNGASPGPVLRFTEGEEVTINVTNNLDESTSVHWHGLIVPFEMDGVPDISFHGIEPGQTFTYRFPIVQAGTYWFHSHSGLQEPDGAYGAIVITPRDGETVAAERDYVVQLTDKHPDAASRILRNLKLMPDYYNRKQQTLFDFFDDVGKQGFAAATAERRAWGEMRMMRTDVEDVQGFVGLINGHGPAQNWTGLFTPGERVRLRFINSSAMTYFDIRIPGVQMQVVQADGNDVQPVSVDELRIAVAETYDVVVQLAEDRAYTIFAESMGRSGYARGTLAPRDGMAGEVPAMRDAPLLTMADMGMGHAGMDMAGMDHSTMGADAMAATTPESVPADAAMDHAAMGHAAMAATTAPEPAPAAVDHAAMGHGAMAATPAPEPAPAAVDHAAMGHGATAVAPAPEPAAAGMDHAAMGHGATPAMQPASSEVSQFYAAGSGLVPSAANGGRFLSYADLKASAPRYEYRGATRELEIRLTGNMERYIWSMDGIKYADAEPIRLQYGERVRFKFVNETMMAHPMHLHGMWSILDTGAGQFNPIKHVVNVSPGTTVYMETEVDAPGEWAFHCHLSYHSSSGMFRKVIVEGGPQQASSGITVGVGG